MAGTAGHAAAGGAGAAAAFDTLAYGNRIGVPARADRLSDLIETLAAQGLSMSEHYGVRVFTDGAGDDAPLPPDDELDAVLTWSGPVAPTRTGGWRR